MGKTYKLFIFDFDGTLGDTTECVVASFQASCSENNIPIPDRDKIKHLMGLSLPEVFKKIILEKQEEAVYEKLIADYRMLYRKYLTQKTKIFPGIKDLLSQLRKKGALCSVATSKKTEFAVTSSQYLGIDQYINLYIGDDMVVLKKPHPEMLEVTLEKLQIQKQEALMIGDSTFDIEMGSAFGIDTCAVTWGAHTKKLLKTSNPTYMIESPLDLLKFA